MAHPQYWYPSIPCALLALTRVDVGIAAEPFLNEALDEDKLESGGVSPTSFPEPRNSDTQADP